MLVERTMINVNEQDAKGMTALMYAALCDYVDIAWVLIKTDVDY